MPGSQSQSPTGSGNTATSTSTSTVSQNTAANDELSIGAGTTYVGDGSTGINVSGSDLSGSVGANISTTINTNSAALVNTLGTAVADLGNEQGAADYLAATSIPQNPTDNTSNGPTGATLPPVAASPLVLVGIVFAVILLIATAKG